MIVLAIICIVLAVEIFFIIRQFMALREILRRSSYSCRTHGNVTERRQLRSPGAPTFRYTVRFQVDEKTYQFRFERQDTDEPLPVGKHIEICYPEGKPSAAYAAYPTHRHLPQGHHDDRHAADNYPLAGYNQLQS